MPIVDINTYQSDPVPSWCQYDLTPSVFSQPATSKSGSETVPPTDPSLDSVFTSGQRARSQTLDDLAARAKALDPSAPSVNADWAMLFASTKRGPSSHPPTSHPDLNPPQSDRVNESMLHTGARDYQPLDTITQVLDTIQLRQADWPTNQSLGNTLSIDDAMDWALGTTTSGVGDRSSLPGGTYGAGGGINEQAPGVPVRPDTMAMWSSVPEGFEYVL